MERVEFGEGLDVVPFRTSMVEDDFSKYRFDLGRGPSFLLKAVYVAGDPTRPYGRSSKEGPHRSHKFEFSRQNRSQQTLLLGEPGPTSWVWRDWRYFKR